MTQNLGNSANENKYLSQMRDLEAALSNFRNALNLEPALFPDLVADSIKSGQIKKFEFTVELLWKTVQVFLLEVDGIREVLFMKIPRLYHETSVWNFCFADDAPE